MENFNQVNLIRFNPGYNANTLVYEQGRDISVRAMIHIIKSDITDPLLLTTAMKPLTKAEKQWFRRHRDHLYLSKEGVLMKRIDNPNDFAITDGIPTYAQIIPPQRRIPEILFT